MTPSDSQRLIRVGVFVSLSLTLFVAMVLFIGRSQSLFSRKVVLNTSFDNISGLVVGAPVRLGGVDIGIVQSIRFDQDLKVKKVRVALGIQSKYLERIRSDSIARLSSKGLLGDMIINISVGSPNFPPLHNGDTLSAQESEGLTQVVESVQDGINEVRTLVGSVDKHMQDVLSDDVTRDIKRGVHAAADVMESIEQGNGLLHDVIYKPELSQYAASLLREAEKSATQLDSALQRVDAVLAAVEKGNGTLHGLVYEQDGSKLLAELRRAAGDLSAVVSEVHGGHGALHTLIYEEGQRNLITDLSAAARALRTVTEEVQQGKGTVGGLLRDPTVYQDLKLIFGNVKRNALLKALVRSAIQSDGLKR